MLNIHYWKRNVVAWGYTRLMNMIYSSTFQTYKTCGGRQLHPLLLTLEKIWRVWAWFSKILPWQEFLMALHRYIENQWLACHLTSHNIVSIPLLIPWKYRSGIDDYCPSYRSFSSGQPFFPPTTRNSQNNCGWFLSVPATNVTPTISFFPVVAWHAGQ